MTEFTKLVYIGADHAGYEVKEQIQKYLKEKEYKVIDLGVFAEGSVDYPDIAREVAEKVSDNEGSFGVLVCGTGVGMSMAANKVFGIRAVQASTRHDAEMSRQHNDANLICFGARTQKFEEITDILDGFMEEAFEGGRHEKRVEKITDIEKEMCKKCKI